MNDAARFKKELLAREYGMNVVKIVNEIANNPDKEARTKQSQLLIKLIEKMNPSVKYTENFEEILWGHIYLMSDMKLDVTVDFKKPSVEVTRPEIVKYPNTRPKYRHYGKNADVLGEELSKLTDEEEKKEAAISYGKLLKTLYSSWNNNSVGDHLIAKNVKELSKGNLSVDASLLDEEGRDSVFYTKRRSPSNNNRNQNSKSHGRSNNNRNNNYKNKNRGRRQD